ncbi:MAG: hypothetical protein IKQ97_04625 [Eubacterium sp.]|nr:hypothetical protein [Eubacterium sp.]
MNKNNRIRTKYSFYRILSVLLMVVLALSVSFTGMGEVHAETQEEKEENTGVHFYFDEACTRRVQETRNEGTKYTRTYTRIQLPRTGGKVYMRMKDSKDIKYRPEKEKIIRVTDKFTVDADGKADMPGFVTVKQLAGSVEGDATYEITIANPDNHDMLYLNPVVADEDDEYEMVNPWNKTYEYLKTSDDRKDDDDDDDDWDERLDVDILYVDFVDEGLNISDPWDVSYMHAWDYHSSDENEVRDHSSWYPGEERLYQNPGAADFGAGFGFSTPFETRPACFLLQENGVSTLLDDGTKLTVYEEDGVTASQRVSIESCKKYNKKSLEGEMFLKASPDVVGHFIIRYMSGEKVYDLPYTIGLPMVGLYTASERSLETLAGQVAQKNEKKHTYYLLSDHPVAWENIVIRHSCDNSYCKNRTNWEMIEDVSDEGLYGFKIRVKPDQDEPYLLHFCERNERGQVTGDSAYTFFYTMAPEVGERFESGLEIFEITEQAGTYGTTGSVRAVKVKKPGEFLVLDGYETQYARNYRVTEIGPAFSANNKKLGYLWLSALKIGRNAFYGCTRLKKIEFWADNVLKIKFGKNAFKGVPSSAIAVIDEVSKKTLYAFTKNIRKAGFRGKIKRRMWTDEWGYDLI